jgi:hypothetical protein
MRKFLLILLVIMTGCDQIQQDPNQELLSRFLKCESENDSLRADNIRLDERLSVVISDSILKAEIIRNLKEEILLLESRPDDTVWIRDTLTIFGWDTVWIAKDRTITEIHPDTIKTDTIFSSDPIYQPSNMLDGVPYISRSDKGSRWMTPKYPHWIALRFDGVQQIDSIDVNVFGWNEGLSHQLTIFSWGDSLDQFETAPVLFSGHKINFVGSQMLIRVDGGDNSWTDIAEIKFWRVD